MDAKDDPYIGFDPITSGEETYFDIETSSWKKKCFRPTGSTSADCSDVIARLNSALSQNQLLNSTLEEERAKLNIRDKEIEKLKSDLSDLNKALLSNSSACEILKAALEPVARLNNDVIYYAIREGFTCEGLTPVEVDDLSGSPSHTAVLDAIRNAPRMYNTEEA